MPSEPSGLSSPSASRSPPPASARPATTAQERGPSRLVPQTGDAVLRGGNGARGVVAEGSGERCGSIGQELAPHELAGDDDLHHLGGAVADFQPDDVA